MHYDRKLDAKLAAAIMSINAFKGVEIGIGFEAAHRPGSEVHDEILWDEEHGYTRRTNNAWFRRRYDDWNANCCARSDETDTYTI